MKPETKFLFAAPRAFADAVRSAAQSVPAGSYLVDADALRKARQGVPTGEYHVDAEALRKARQGVPTGEYHRQFDGVDPFHVDVDGLSFVGCAPTPQLRCPRCRAHHALRQCPAAPSL